MHQIPKLGAWAMESDTSTLTYIVDRLVAALDSITIAIEDSTQSIVNAIHELDKSIGYIDLSHDS